MTIKIAKVTLALALLAPAPALAAGIEFKAPTVYPEGIAHDDKSGDIFVSSMRHGTIGVVKDGKYKAFAKDAQLISSVGLHADPERGRLLACVSDPGVSEKTSPKTQKKLARLMAFDLKTGKRKNTVDLSALAPEGQHFCNDITIDGDGNAYVTDSFSPIVYRVDPAFKATVFLKDDKFKGQGFGLNGLVHHKDGFLIVAKSDDGTLWKVNEKGPPVAEEIKLSEKLVNADGLVMSPAGELIVIQNETHRAARVKSTDGWKTAKVDKTVTLDAAYPTTAVFAGDKLYVNLSHLNELFADPKKAKTDTFTLTEVAFP
jgi:sugar lactone lactonase YvrE